MSRTLTTVVALAAALSLLPGVAAAQTRTGDYASGAGFWHGDDPDDLGPGSVGFQATQFIAADDEFAYRRQGDGRGFHAEPVCVAVDGNEAWMTLAVTRSDPGIPPVLVAYVEDNGATGDLFDLDEPVTNVFDDHCGTRTVVFDPDPVSGRINLADTGLFGLPF
jgi:hypothetical protein